MAMITFTFLTLHRMKPFTTLLLSVIVSTLSIRSTAQPGTLDPSFSGDGIQILQPGSGHDVGKEIIALDDHSSLICGVTFAGGAFSGFVAHIQENGTVDNSFGANNGYTFVDLGEETYFYDMELNPDGTFLVCGLTYVTYPNSQVLLAKFLANGTLDPTFGNGGVVTTPIGNAEAEAQKMALQADGKILLAGRAGFGGTADGLILRYTVDGTLDSTFSDDGYLLTNQFPGSEDQFYGVDVLNDGSIVAAGHVDQNFLYKTMVAKVTSSGSFDNTFNGNGTLVPDLAPQGDEAYNLLAKGDQFYVCGYLALAQDNRNMYLARYTASGALDATFGVNGIATVDANANEVAYDIVLENDGKVLFCGTSGPFGFFAPRDMLVARFTFDGALDNTFGNAGVTITNVQPDFDDANGMAIQPDGKVIVTGFSAGTNNDLVLARYLNDVGGIGISEMDQGTLAAHVFPNPVGQQLMIANGQLSDRLMIFDASGRLVLETTGLGRAINVSALNAGSYHLRISGETGIRQASFVKD
jgi:uncharacterized delta-60 repeat protein